MAKPPVQLGRHVSTAVGLGVRALDEGFEKHFGISSTRIKKVLSSSDCDSTDDPADPDKVTWGVAKRSPSLWGLRVRFVSQIWQYVGQDIVAYAAAHFRDEEHRHVCAVPRCRWHHGDVPMATRSTATGELRPMQADMHLVVERYVKPWTKDEIDAGLAIMLNAGYLSSHRSEISIADLCKAEVFVSHSWSEEFNDFAQTLSCSLDPDAVAWVCSFAIWQHGDIGDNLKNLDKCPFAVALRASSRVLTVTDHKASVFERCWVVFEAALSREWGKTYDVSLPNDSNVDAWRKVNAYLLQLDVADCKATVDRDKEVILEHAGQQPGGVVALNRTVSDVASRAMTRAEVMAAATVGDINRLKKEGADCLRQWRNIRGRSVIHLAAANSRVAAVVELLNMVGEDQIDVQDNDGLTPLGTAVENNSLAGVEALISLSANLNVSSRFGLTPLHIACARGCEKIGEALLSARADTEAEGCYLGSSRRPLHVAVREGHREIVNKLIGHRADVNATASNGVRPLFVAAVQGHSDISAALLLAMADVEARTADKHGRTALMRAVAHGHVALTGLLLAAGADPLAKDNDAFTVYDCCKRCERAAPEKGRILRTLLDGSINSGACRRMFHKTAVDGASFEGAPNILERNLSTSVESITSTTGSESQNLDNFLFSIAPRRNSDTDKLELARGLRERSEGSVDTTIGAVDSCDPDMPGKSKVRKRFVRFDDEAESRSQVSQDTSHRPAARVSKLPGPQRRVMSIVLFGLISAICAVAYRFPSVLAK